MNSKLCMLQPINACRLPGQLCNFGEQSSVLDSFKDSENIVSPALLKRFMCMEKKEKKQVPFNQCTGNDHFRSSLTYSAEIHCVLSRKLTPARHTEISCFILSWSCHITTRTTNAVFLGDPSVVLLVHHYTYCCTYSAPVLLKRFGM